MANQCTVPSVVNTTGSLAHLVSDAERLFGLILPQDGFRACAVEWMPKDSDRPALFTRMFYMDCDLSRFLIAHGSRTDVWFSTSTFSEVGDRSAFGGFKGKRDERNLHSRQCLHGDIDAGGDKAYPRFEWAKAALEWAVAKLGLPRPILIRSGHGLHFYWPLLEPIVDIRLWRAYAEGMTAALVGQGLKIDAQCSVDPVRLLRPPGTLNHKGGGRLPIAVDEWGDGPTKLSAFDAFKGQVRLLARKQREEGQEITPIPISEFPAVLRRCGQLNHFARMQGVVSEPEWKACIGVLAFVEDGRAIAHEYSKGDSRYDPDETDKKFDARMGLSGPSRCTQFQKLDNGAGDAGLCDQCTWRSVVTTPLQLGRLL